MKTEKYSSHPNPVLTQLKSNASFWIGHMYADPAERIGGQTFLCPADGELDNIQVYSAAVQNPGKVVLTLHAFDCEAKKWGPVLASTEMEVDKKYSENWIRFQLSSIFLHKNNNYGFRIASSDALIALGEEVWPNNSPFICGEEWTGNNLENHGQYFRYFSLAFRVEMRA